MRGRLRLALAGVLLAIFAFGHIQPVSAQARASRFGAVDYLFLIGMTHQLVRDVGERDRCQSHAENMAQAQIGFVTGTAGVILGTIAGSALGDGVASAGIGGVFGAWLGREGGRALGSELGSVVGDEAGRGVTSGEPRRDLGEEFDFQLCHMIAASNVLKAPLVERYLQIAANECSFNPADVRQMSNRDWDGLYRCNNGNNVEAREIMLQLIRINQATCFGIEKLGRALAEIERTDIAVQGRSASLMPFYSGGDEFCDDRSPAQVWSSFLRDRRP